MSNDKGIIEATADYIAETAEAVGDYFGAKSNEAEHKAKEEG
eukprot:CAMPEP_0206156854 /NCGR_PEP_ID=MMETSP1474-20131121/3379_1 /ASSEMBLY_ACC=CAM_ASM_001110 /TAXON_ID=97495 /ORGANISM="Imantonia sp., Strain RCC918" /LENGTH=41 /DNA_ID= /DNA_START= /DNA_END= /DNA_ORIENTATION=